MPAGRKAVNPKKSGAWMVFEAWWLSSTLTVSFVSLQQLSFFSVFFADAQSLQLFGVLTADTDASRPPQKWKLNATPITLTR